MSNGSPGARSVEELLREHGFTPFHRMIVIVTGMAWTFVALEILLIAFSLPVFADLWELSGVGLGWIGSASLIGTRAKPRRRMSGSHIAKASRVARCGWPMPTA